MVDWFEEEDWGPDEGWYRAYRDGLPAPPATAAPPEDDLDLDDQDLRLSTEKRALLANLLRAERAMSARRHTLHARIDFIRSQGSSTKTILAQLEYLTRQERELSDRRAQLQREIDKIRDYQGRAPR